jgi:predicted short-subunit dehydrogenase-like oxidoreductase (DUF2520 family)
MEIAVVGAGRVAAALAVLLQRAGHAIVAVSGRQATAERAARFLPGVPVVSDDDAARAAAVVLIGTPDASIGPVCSALASAGALGGGSSVVHLSGATGLDALEGARSAGASVLCLHPLQTCPNVEAAIARIPGSAFAVTGSSDAAFELGERLARDVGGRPFCLEDAMKPLYHAAAVLASNDLVALTALAERVARTAGVPDPMEALIPLQCATLDNVEAMGPGAALTGPAVRGDAGTVAANLEALGAHAPDAVPVYVALADAASDLAVRSGRLAPEGHAAVREVLDRWR